MGIKYSVNEKSFDSWSHEMAYVLGFLFADGTIYSTPYNRGKYVSATSIDRESIQTVKTFLQSAHPIVAYKPPTEHHSVKYTLKIGSHKLHDSLMKHSLYQNKSLTVTMPKIPRKYLADFIRGNFDGDGCVFIEMKRTKDNKGEFVRCLKITFSSGSKKFLEQLSNCLEIEVLQMKMPVYNNGGSYQLRYSTANSIRLFKFLYNNAEKPFYLSRKLNTFKRYFTLRPKKVDSKVRKMIMAM